MEGEHCKKVPSVPSNFITLVQLKERWLQKKQKEKEEEEEKARLQRQIKEEEEEEERNSRKEKEEQQRKTRIQQNRYGARPRSNNIPTSPFHRNRRNQCPGRGLDGDDDGEQKPAKTHVAEVSSYAKRRTGWKDREQNNRNRRNQCPGGGSGDDKTTPEETHIGESVAEVTEPRKTHVAEVPSYVKRRNGWKNRAPIDRNRLNQCPGGVAGDGKVKPEETHIGESVAEQKIDGSLKRNGSEKEKPLHRSRRNRSPVGGSGETLGKTHVTEVVPEGEGLKIDDDSIKRDGSERRGSPRVNKEDSTGVLLVEKGENKEIKVGGKGRSEEKKALVDGSLELERKFEKISLCGGGGEGFNGRHYGYVHGGGYHRKYDKDSGGFCRRKRKSNLVWVKKEG